MKITVIPEIENYIRVAKKFYAGKATQKELWAASNAADRAAANATNRAPDRSAFWAAYWAADSAAMQKKLRAKLIEIIKEAK